MAFVTTTTTNPLGAFTALFAQPAYVTRKGKRVKADRRMCTRQEALDAGFTVAECDAAGLVD